jgi:hypothetical protein
MPDMGVNRRSPLVRLDYPFDTGIKTGVLKFLFRSTWIVRIGFSEL